MIGQPPSIQWSKCYGGSANDAGNSIILAPGGGYYFAGFAASHDGDVANNTGHYKHLWIVKIDELGNIIWERTYGGTWGDEVAKKIRPTADGGLIVVGWASSVDGDVSGLHSFSSTSYPADAWVVKVDSTGNLEWQKCLGGYQDDEGEDIIQTSDGGFLVGATISSMDGDVLLYHGGMWDCWLVKLDSLGNLVWENSFGGSFEEGIYSVYQLDSTRYIALGSTTSTDQDITFNHGATDVWMLVVDTSGQLIQQKTFGGTDNDGGSSIIKRHTGLIEFNCGTQSNDGDVQLALGGTDFWQFTTDGNMIINQHSYGGSDIEVPFSSILTSDQGSLICGYSFSGDGQASCTFTFMGNFWIVKTDSVGNYEWSKCLGGIEDETAMEGIETPDGGYIIIGYTISNDGDVSGNHGGSDVWVVKLSPPGVNVPELSAAITDFSAFENLFGALQINFTAEITSALKLTLFDLTGRDVYFEELTCTGGKNSLTTSALLLSPGIYILQLSDEDGMMTKKIFVHGAN